PHRSAVLLAPDKVRMRRRQVVDPCAGVPVGLRRCSVRNAHSRAPCISYSLARAGGMDLMGRPRYPFSVPVRFIAGHRSAGTPPTFAIVLPTAAHWELIAPGMR